MNIGIAYADRFDKLWLRLEVPDGSTIEDAIHRSGLLQRFPDIDLSRQKVGIFGRVTKLSATIRDGDRVEIYRDIVADPQTTPRRDSD
jgi:putative ubiquitin-RnfH superfamily antitoxin RatB of RatAB toxin-antitoxin module